MLSSKGAAIVVQSPRAAEVIGGVVPRDRLLEVPLPVRIPEKRLRVTEHTLPVLLFVGGGRPEKGLDRLLHATSLLPSGAVSLRIVGLQPQGLTATLQKQFPSIPATWIDRFITDEELDREYRESSLVVLPYRREFSDRGGASTVLLEALAHGLPIVTTPTLSSQLPNEGRCYIVARSDSSSDLAEAILSAIRDLDMLADEAREVGPRFIAERHGYDSYVQVLQRALASHP